MPLRTALLASLLLFTACPQPPATATPAPGGIPPNLQLRSYEVPNQGAQRLRGVLMQLLWFGSDSKDSNKYVGRADVGPDGRLIVLAPESVHEGVKAIVASVTAHPVKEPGTVRIDYFSGLSTAQMAEALGIPPGTVSSRRSLAMAALEKALGPLEGAS